MGFITFSVQVTQFKSCLSSGLGNVNLFYALIYNILTPSGAFSSLFAPWACPSFLSFPHSSDSSSR